jgi:hypothetical protein
MELNEFHRIVELYNKHYEEEKKQNDKVERESKRVRKK